MVWSIFGFRYLCHLAPHSYLFLNFYFLNYLFYLFRQSILPYQYYILPRNKLKIYVTWVCLKEYISSFFRICHCLLERHSFLGLNLSKLKKIVNFIYTCILPYGPMWVWTDFVGFHVSRLDLSLKWYRIIFQPEM